MKRVLFSLAVLGMLALGQNAAPLPMSRDEVVRIVEVRNADPTEVVRTLSAVLPGISRNGRMLVIRGSESVTTMIEDAVKKLDVVPVPPPEARPASNIELTVQLLYGSSEAIQTAPIPGDLDATLRQLRALFPYKSYRVMDTLFMRGRNGNHANLNGTLPGDNSTYTMQYSGSVLAGPAPRTIRLDQLQVQFQLKHFSDASKTNYQFSSSAIQTNLDAREGQKTVVGKANITGTDDAIILVITPKIID